MKSKETRSKGSILSLVVPPGSDNVKDVSDHDM